MLQTIKRIFFPPNQPLTFSTYQDDMLNITILISWVSLLANTLIFLRYPPEQISYLGFVGVPFLLTLIILRLKPWMAAKHLAQIYIGSIILVLSGVMLFGYDHTPALTTTYLVPILMAGFIFASVRSTLITIGACIVAAVLSSSLQIIPQEYVFSQDSAAIFRSQPALILSTCLLVIGYQANLRNLFRINDEQNQKVSQHKQQVDGMRRNQEIERVALQVTEQHLQQLISHAPVGVFLIEEDGSTPVPLNNKNQFMGGPLRHVKSLINNQDPLIMDNVTLALQGEVPQVEIAAGNYHLEARFERFKNTAQAPPARPRVVMVITDRTESIRAKHAQERHTKLLERRLNISNIVYQHQTLPDTLNAIVKNFVNSFHETVHSAALTLVEDEHHEGDYVATYGEGITRHIGRDVVRHIFEDPKPYVIANTSYDPFFTNDYDDSRMIGQIKSLAALPLMVNGEMRGVISLYNHTRYGVFDEEVLSLLQDMLDDACTAIELIVAHREAQTQREIAEQMTRHTIEREERERKRLAREIHDSLGAEMSRWQIGLLNSLKNIPPKGNEDLIQQLELIAARTEHLYNSIRSVSSKLRPELLEELGLIVSFKSYIRDFEEQTGLNVRFNSPNITHAIPEDVQLMLYRILQEGMNNAVRHGQATHIEVKLGKQDDQITLQIQDNGMGFEPNAQHYRSGGGISNMRERVLLLSGDFSLSSIIGKGTLIEVRVPLRSRED